MDGHSAWVNTAALALAGIERNTPDPPGGLIERDPVTGEATGTLREWAAMELVENHLPEPTARDRITAGWAFLEQAGRLGIVSVHEAMAKEEELQTYQTLDREGDLTLRVQAALLCEPGKGLAQIEELRDLRHTFQGGRLAPRAAKLFVDGVVEGHTAWLLAPYEDRPGFYGERLWEPGDLNRTAAALDRAGFQLHFHAVGDGAVRNALDAVAYTAALNGPRDRRPMIAHGDLISSEDLPRFCALGVIANLQPLWFYEERNFRKTTLPFLGSERAWHMYTIRSLLDAGAAVACGTDWPFSGELNTFDPLASIRVGLTRRGLDPDAAPAYAPDECLSLAALIDAHTHGGAFADFAEETTGSVTVGKSADLVCLDRNLFLLPPEDVFRAKALLTLLEGRTVYRAVS
jgi:predicted amidohydrolase YtcJ